MLIVGAILLLLVAVFLWGLNLVGLPGNWLVIGAAAAYAWFVPAESRLDVGLWTLLGLTAVALLGEGVEFLAGAMGAKKAGGSRRSAVLALLGSMAGGLFGLTVGLPIPIVGSIAAALVFAGLGALGGAVLGEQWKGRPLDHSLRVGESAFWGRILGTFGKTAMGALMIVVLAIAILF